MELIVALILMYPATYFGMKAWDRAKTAYFNWLLERGKIEVVNCRAQMTRGHGINVAFRVRQPLDHNSRARIAQQFMIGGRMATAIAVSDDMTKRRFWGCELPKGCRPVGMVGY